MNLGNMYYRVRPKRLFVRLVLIVVSILIIGTGGLSLHVVKEETELAKKRDTNTVTILSQHIATMIGENVESRNNEKIIQHLQAI